MTASKLQRRDLLLVGLGHFVNPLRRLAGNSADRARRLPYVRAQFAADLSQFQSELNAFCTHDNHRFEPEYHAARRASNRFTPIFEQLQQGRPHDQVMRDFDEALGVTLRLIRAIPADDEDAIIPTGSPFSAFLQIRASCAAAVSRQDLFEPYLDAESYHRYIADVPASTVISAVTDSRTMQPLTTENRALQRRDRIVAVSTLLAEQRPDTYRFAVVERLHDRQLRVDDQVYHLGGSLKDAARAASYTLTRMDPSTAVQSALEAQLNGAILWFPDPNGEHRKD